MPSRRASTTPSSALEDAGRDLQRVSDVFHQLVGTDSNDALLRIEREISPREAAHWNKVRMNEALFAPHRRAVPARATGSDFRAEQARVLERHHTSFRRQGAALDPDKQAPARRDHRAAGRARHRLQPERAGRRAGLRARARRRGRSRRAARLRARGRARRRRGARQAGQARHHACSAPASSRSCNSPRAATCARRRSAPGSRAATTTTRPTTRRSSPRPSRCAPSAPSCWAIRRSRTTGSTTPWPRRRRRCADCWKRSGRRRARARSPTATPCRS